MMCFSKIVKREREFETQYELSKKIGNQMFEWFGGFSIETKRQCYKRLKSDIDPRILKK